MIEEIIGVERPTAGIHGWHTETLVRRALRAKNHDTAWKFITALHWRGTREVLDAASRLCRSSSSHDRGIGADILGQLGLPERTFPQETLEILHDMLRAEQEAEVLADALVAIGHAQDAADTSNLDLVIEKAHHKEEDVRYGAVFALLGRDDHDSISTMIELSKDPDEDVRNWATFGLGSMIESDTPKIRDALLERLSEKNAEIRGEALVGLAERNHPNTIGTIIKELNTRRINILVLEAAEILRSPELYPLLTEWREGHDDPEDCFDHQLERAWRACAPENA